MLRVQTYCINAFQIVRVRLYKGAMVKVRVRDRVLVKVMVRIKCCVYG